MHTKCGGEWTSQRVRRTSTGARNRGSRGAHDASTCTGGHESSQPPGRQTMTSDARRTSSARQVPPDGGAAAPAGHLRGLRAAQMRIDGCAARFAALPEPALNRVKYPVLWQSRKQQHCVVFAPRLESSTGSTRTARATLRCGTGRFARPKTLALPGVKCSARPASPQLGSGRPYRELTTITKPGIVLLWRGRAR